MSETNLEPRVSTLESDLRTLNDTVGTLAEAVRSQAETTNKQIGRLATQQAESHQDIIRQQASQHQQLMTKQTDLAVSQAQTGKLGGTALIAIVSTAIGLIGLIVTIMTVLGAMAIQPMQAMDARVEGMVMSLKSDVEHEQEKFDVRIQREFKDNDGIIYSKLKAQEESSVNRHNSQQDNIDIQTKDMRRRLEKIESGQFENDHQSIGLNAAQWERIKTNEQFIALLYEKLYGTPYPTKRKGLGEGVGSN